MGTFVGRVSDRINGLLTETVHGVENQKKKRNEREDNVLKKRT